MLQDTDLRVASVCCIYRRFDRTALCGSGLVSPCLNHAIRQQVNVFMLAKIKASVYRERLLSWDLSLSSSTSPKIT